MRIIKTALTVLIIAVALVAAVVALYWEQLLTPEQKLQYGLTFSAASDYAARARAHPDNPKVLADYVNALVITGNLGRAQYLCDLHGTEHEMLRDLRAAIERSLAASAKDEVYALSEDEAVKAVADLPLSQALRYVEGYQYALKGDWASARNYFKAIDEKRLAPVLKPYWRYYLARCYRLAGDDADRGELEKLLLSVTHEEDLPQLAAKAHYNLISWYLSDGYPGKDGLTPAHTHLVALAHLPSDWAQQKAYTEFAEYYLRQGDYAAAWEMIQLGLLIDTQAQAGKRCVELAIEALTLLVDDEAAWGLDSQGAISLPLAANVFVDIATGAVRHGYAVEAAGLLDRLKPHLADNNRDHWEELRVGMAVCYRAERDSGALKELMADANLRDLSEASLGEIYYQHAQVLEQERQWNSALEYYRSAARICPARAGEALLSSYAILKQVQDPLDLDRAVELLRQVVEDYPGSPAMPKAIEELLPLLVYRNETQAARRLAEWVSRQATTRSATSAAQLRNVEQLAEVVDFWDAYLLEHAGNAAGADEARARIPNKYWNYYELTSRYPPRPQLSPGSVALERDESAGEYLVGLGLTDSARESFEDTGGADDPVFQYLSLLNQESIKPLHTLQWNATELLESGMIGEQAVLDYVLPLAYPRPYRQEVEAAAAEFNVPANLIWAVMKKESNFRSDSVSWAGAEGLMQIMPPTARWLDGKFGMGLGAAELTDPAVNIRLGAAYLASLQEIFGAGNTRAVIHAYNGGDGNFRKWRERYGTDQVLLTELIPNEENETFGKKVIRYYKVYDWLGSR